jgi:hypothetical protein
VDKFKDTLLDLRLALIWDLEKPPSDRYRKVESLQHTASAESIADIATKGKVTKEHVDVQGVWQNDPNYLQYDKDDSWPINGDMLSASPDDEKHTSARMLQARYRLELVYGQITANVVLAGNLGLEPQQGQIWWRNCQCPWACGAGLEKSV